MTYPVSFVSLGFLYIYLVQHQFVFPIHSLSHLFAYEFDRKLFCQQNMTSFTKR